MRGIVGREVGKKRERRRGEVGEKEREGGREEA